MTLDSLVCLRSWSETLRRKCFWSVAASLATLIAVFPTLPRVGFGAEESESPGRTQVACYYFPNYHLGDAATRS